MIKTDRECRALVPEEGKQRIVKAVYSGGNKGLCLEAREGANKSYGTRAFTGNPLILND